MFFNRRAGALFLVVIITVLLFGGSSCIEKVQNLWETDKGQDLSHDLSSNDINEQQDFPDNQQRKILLYYLDEQARFLVPVTRSIPWTEAIARETLKYLVTTPEREEELRPLGLQPILPEGTEVLGISIKEEVARVDFNDAFIQYKPENERYILDSLTFTLTQFPTINKVSLMVEGTTLETMPGGAPGDELVSPEHGINLEIDSEIEELADTNQVVLYFCYYAGDRFFYVPVTRVIKQTDDLPSKALEELLAGPRRSRNLFSNIPEETELRSITQEDDLIIIDFSADILNYGGGKQGEENIVNQIVLTLSELPQINRVQILVEGQKIVLEEGLSLLEPFERPIHINEI